MNKKIDTLENRLLSLEKNRLLYPFRVPRGLPEEILKHKNAVSISYYLELKSLYKSGVIHNYNGKKPHELISKWLNISLSGWRLHYAILKDLNLIKTDCRRNIHFCGWREFKSKLRGKKYSLKHHVNTHSFPAFVTKQKNYTYEIIYSAFISENEKRQEYEYKYKLAREIALNDLAEKQINRYCKKNTYERPENRNFNVDYFLNDFLQTEQSNIYLETIIGRYMSKVKKHYKEFLFNDRAAYREKYLGGYNENLTANPFFTMSQKCISRHLGCANSTAFYNLKKLEALKFIRIKRETQKLNDRAANCTATYEHYNRPNFVAVDACILHRIETQTHEKNKKYLYNTVVKMPNLIYVNIL